MGLETNDAIFTLLSPQPLFGFICCGVYLDFSVTVCI